ncbi:glutaredoxin family protein [Robertmurraya siralis]|uniref:glutaredoxin family protein n=1 Tax=Robertmurraya siralis TaxID=77777 RepID=UPI0010F663C2|nr:glutaredoxin family protein [Robertmurraya siralis]
MNLIKYMKDGCVPCNLITNLLDEKGVKYIEINALKDSKEKIEERYGSLGVIIEEIKNNLSGVPVLVLLNDNKEEVGRVSGFNPDEIDSLLRKLN